MYDMANMLQDVENNFEKGIYILGKYLPSVSVGVVFDRLSNNVVLSKLGCILLLF